MAAERSSLFSFPVSSQGQLHNKGHFHEIQAQSVIYIQKHNDNLKTELL